jgi:hypothetical protein
MNAVAGIPMSVKFVEVQPDLNGSFIKVHLDLCALRLVAVRLPMPLRMQLCVHLAPCLFLFTPL